MADVYAQCVDNVLEMIAERKQDAELANQLNSKADPREKVSENDANAATALVALLRTLAAGKEFADGVHYVAITSVISERVLKRHFNTYMNLGSLPHSERGLQVHGKSHSWLDDRDKSQVEGHWHSLVLCLVVGHEETVQGQAPEVP